MCVGSIFTFLDNADCPYTCVPSRPFSPFRASPPVNAKAFSRKDVLLVLRCSGHGTMIIISNKSASAQTRPRSHCGRAPFVFHSFLYLHSLFLLPYLPFVLPSPEISISTFIHHPSPFTLKFRYLDSQWVAWLRRVRLFQGLSWGVKSI